MRQQNRFITSSPISFNHIEVQKPISKNEAIREMFYDRSLVNLENDRAAVPPAKPQRVSAKKSSISPEARRARMMYARTFLGKKNNAAAINGGGLSNAAALKGGGSYDKAALKGGKSYNKAALKGGRSYDKAALKGGSSYDKAALKGGSSYNKAALKGGRSYNKAALKGGKSYNKAALKGGRSYNKAAVKGGSLLGTIASAVVPAAIGAIAKGVTSGISAINQGVETVDNSLGPGATEVMAASSGITDELTNFISSVKADGSKKNLKDQTKGLSQKAIDYIKNNPKYIALSLGVKLFKTIWNMAKKRWEELKQAQHDYDNAMYETAKNFAENVENIH